MNSAFTSRSTKIDELDWVGPFEKQNAPGCDEMGKKEEVPSGSTPDHIKI